MLLSRIITRFPAMMDQEAETAAIIHPDTENHKFFRWTEPAGQCRETGRDA